MILTLPLIGSTCRWYVIGGRWNSPVRMSSATLRANRSRSGWRSRNRLASLLWPLPLRQASMHSRTNAGSVTGECLQYVLIFRVLISYGDNGGFRCVYRPPSRFDFRNWPGLGLLASHAGGSRDGMVVFLLSSWAAAVVPPRVRERVPAVRAEQAAERTVVEIAAAVERRRMEPPVVSSRIP